MSDDAYINMRGERSTHETGIASDSLGGADGDYHEAQCDLCGEHHGREAECPALSATMSEGESYHRASQDAVCAACGKRYQDHPREILFEAFNGEEMTLRRLCNGSLVKL